MNEAKIEEEKYTQTHTHTHLHPWRMECCLKRALTLFSAPGTFFI